LPFYSDERRPGRILSTVFPSARFPEEEEAGFFPAVCETDFCLDKEFTEPRNIALALALTIKGMFFVFCLPLRAAAGDPD
jgi:hypothetical protein